MTITGKFPKSAVFPESAEVNDQNHLVISDCDTVALAHEFGTPLYVFDEATLRGKCAEYREEFAQRYPDTLVIYACKAFINRPLAQLFKEEGLGLDVVSGGELAIAKSVRFPMERIYFNGNNKARDELQMAIDLGVARIIVDNFHELSVLNEVAKEAGVVQNVLLRLCPGVDAHTNAHTATGVIDSKFGFNMAQAEEALVQAMTSPNINLLGLHFHLGSPIFEVQLYQEAIDIIFGFAAKMVERHGFKLKEFSPGGGFAIQYTDDVPAPTTAQYADVISSALLNKSREVGIAPPRLIVEPGRAIVGQAGVALYTVGATKDIPGVRKYVSVDGGMADNIRPVIYEARYEAVVANKVKSEILEPVCIVGKWCESGDILIKDITLPILAPGDIIAIPSCGAYCLAMASNYNLSLKPPIALIKNAHAKIIRRRESYDDLISHDVI